MRLQYARVISAFVTLSVEVISSSLLSGCITRQCTVYKKNDAKLIGIAENRAGYV